MDNRNHYFINYLEMKDFIHELYKETEDLEEFVKKCNFLNVDYGDGNLYTIKFWSINTFLANGDRIFEVFNKLLKDLKLNPYDGLYDSLYEILKKDICPLLTKIYH